MRNLGKVQGAGMGSEVDRVQWRKQEKLDCEYTVIKRETVRRNWTIFKTVPLEKITNAIIRASTEGRKHESLVIFQTCPVT